MKIKKETGKKIGAILLRALATAPFVLATVCPSAFATEVTTQINNITIFVLEIIQAAGVVIAAWGVFEFANGYQSHDGTQQTNGLKRIIAGLIMIAASSVMTTFGIKVPKKK